MIGYVGRLAPEKQVEDLAVLRDIPGTRIVIVGDGPSRTRLESLLPEAVFLGHLDGLALASAMASFDLFVHPGESETFGQTLQEAHASGVPVIATGRGGPLDLVRMGIDGWLYRPGDHADLRMRVADLAGDARKRQAFGAAGHAAVQSRSWASVCDQLLAHYDEARTLHRADRGARARRTVRPEAPVAVAPRRWRRFVALGDSLTEGLCDPAPDGALRGWADRLALLLAAQGGLHYANLAIRSKRVRDVPACRRSGRWSCARPRLDPDRRQRPREAPRGRPRPRSGTRRCGRAAQEAGADVLLVTPFLPGRRAAVIYTRRFAAFATALAGIAARTGAMLIDTDLYPSLAERPNWGEDLVHLSSRGHRFLAYRAGEMLGVPDADALGLLDAALHEHEPIGVGVWWRRHALPWVWRRLHGRAAGDGRASKHQDYVYLGRTPAGRGVTVG
ncbi:glycosyltransferase [Microbacterium sp. Se63.02b]|uniref:glycosyltransferase n=1 Tax=Microbacterium sp. Se63.02b TaxID=2709304 RepID=UPI001FCE9D32|nr:glycosyltransferase [Microbacterium sp. Se63.02b]